MTRSDDLAGFILDLQEEIEVMSDADEEKATFREEAFTSIYVDHLIDVGELDDGDVVHYEGSGNRLKASGFAINEDEDRLDLFISLYRQATAPETIPRADVEVAIRKVQNFFRRAVDGLHQRLDSASRAHDMAQRIHLMRTRIRKIRIFLFTDGVTNVDTRADETIDGIEYTFNLWDVERFYRSRTSGRQRAAITIDLITGYGQAVPCLELPGGALDYDACLAIFPGAVLARIYDNYGARLLERNVRAFLQVRGGVNKGIRKTLHEEPHRFLAYNNGISATASRVEYTTLADGRRAISRIHDLQIVNGGQTTASLYSVMMRDKKDLSLVHVQAKISIVDRERMEEMVPLISRYANSQNKVSDADFSANDGFHVQVEELSRTVWAPATGSAQRQTHWFYERARGQYADARTRAKVSGKQREERIFLESNPKDQSFTKTDLAKYANTLEQLPYIVSRGAQKNFNEFTIRFGDRGTTTVDRQYFQRIVAMAILFRDAERIVKECQYGGYRANDVTYTLAYLSRKTGKRIDLDRIWKEQKVSAALEDTIRLVSARVHEVVVDAPDGGNVTEWCKKEACWRRIEALEIELPQALIQELTIAPCELEAAPAGVEIQVAGPLPDDAPSGAADDPVRALLSVRPSTWSDLNQWLVRNQKSGAQRPLVLQLARLASSPKHRVTPDLARRGLSLLADARERGFQG